MQGGSIGVSSTQNLGSTFSFYIKSRRAPAPHYDVPSRPRSKADLISQNPNKKETSSENTSPSRSPKETKKIVKKEKEQEKKKYHILVVEDNLINQRVLTNQLTKLGHTCHVANHGLEALALLEKSHFAAQKQSQSTPSSQTPTTTQSTSPTSPSPSSPLADLIPLSVVLMDIEMPLMDGLTATRRIRAMENSGQLQGHVPIIAVSANARREQVMQAKEAGVDEAICKPFRIPELVRLLEGLGL
jgi:CheY-like chemotaxis protein